ncbi:MAG: hypothetical protein HYW49_06780 [Deltaproteobacteria bacterium]|nr:hypothetical protein [Deltaproteobacteria bacterium]
MATTATVVTNTDRCPACKAENVPLKEVYGVPICDKCAAKMFSEKVRERIKDAWERQQENKRRELWGKRVQLVKKGMFLFEQRKHQEALKNFREYIAILENNYKVPAGGLHPGLFDQKKEIGDILLISGIFWDMAKIYDHLKDRRNELQMCLNKYVEFSLNRPHVVLSAHGIKKHLKHSKVQHRDLFSNAHKVLRGNVGKCFIATAVFGPQSPEVRILQQFRDDVLARSLAGRAVIRAYYLASPPLARLTARTPALASVFRAVLRRFVRIIKS